jgi:putative serine protease PepD
VDAIFPDSPADKAGLRKDDIILKMDGNDAGTLPEFVQKVGEKKPGDKVKLLVKREGQEKTIEVTLGKKSDNKEQ